MYKWRFNMGVDAQVAGKELERIEGEEGKITPQSVLDNSRAEDAPLHPCFEWDDSKAAEAHRLHQASCIISNIVVVSDNENVQPTRAFVNVETKAPTKRCTFVNIRTAFDDPVSREIVLKNAIGELRQFKEKYHALQELANVMVSINQVLEEAAS